MTVFYKIFIPLIFGLILSSCFTTKKISIDSGQLSSSDYYSGNIDGGKKLFVKINNYGSNSSGEFCVTSDKPVTKLHKFTAINNGKIFKTKTDTKGRFSKLKGVATLSNDTLTLIWFNKLFSRKKYKEIKLIKESKLDLSKFSQRYLNTIFPNYNLTTLKYGKAEGYYASKFFPIVNESNYGKIMLNVGKNIIGNLLQSEQTLDLDLYEPKDDTLSKRPLIVLFHGGSFLIGDKKAETMVELGEYFSKMGYVVASVNYRLGYLIMPGRYDYMERSIYRALQDGRAALRYLCANAAKFRIDTNKIIVGGTSAGGFTALNIAYLEEKERFTGTYGNVFRLQGDLGCIDCSTNEYKNKFSVKGVVNMWGALTDINQFDSYEKIPILSFHGTADNVVPIDNNFPFNSFGEDFTSFFAKKVYGSKEIHKRAVSLGIKNRLIEIEGAGHEPQVDENSKFTNVIDTIKNVSKDFIFDLVAYETTGIMGDTLVSSQDFIKSYSVPNNKGYKYDWNIEGGVVSSLNSTNNEAKIVWFDNEENHSVRLSIINNLGAVISKKITITIQ